MSSPAEPLLHCADLRFAYLDRFTALDGVSLTVGAGERLALLGANGCGKSTLLKILDGLLFPAAGRYTAFGRRVTEAELEDAAFAAEFRQRVGFVFQSSEAQVFSATVREEIAIGPLQLGLAEDEVQARIGDLLDLLGIAALADRAPYRLSAGEKKRVAIAAVLAGNPDVLLFDEPTAGLDPRTRRWMLELIAELGAAGKTIVCATHDLDSLAWVAGRCVVLSEAHRVLADASPEELLGDRALLAAANLVEAGAAA